MQNRIDDVLHGGLRNTASLPGQCGAHPVFSSATGSSTSGGHEGQGPDEELGQNRWKLRSVNGYGDGYDDDEDDDDEDGDEDDGDDDEDDDDDDVDDYDDDVDDEGR